jgi:hypothetical protein
MRIAVSLAMATTALMWGAGARAQQPIDPYQPEPAVAPGPPPGFIPPAPPAVLPPPPAPAARPAPAAQPIDPYSAYPAPPAYGYQSPQGGPAVVASPPAYERGYYLYSTPGAPPVYYAPPPTQFRPSCPNYCGCAYGCQPLRLRAAKRKWDGVRRFSLGAHFGFMSLDQKVGGNAVVLGGAGFQLRLRSSGHFGFEASQSFLTASYYHGAYERDSYPFQLSLMFYLFPNRDAHHLNFYALAGVGLMGDNVSLYNENGRKVTQDFTEYEVHAGGGAELRFKWFGIEADARYVKLWRDDSSTPASYYAGQSGAPVQNSGQGVQGNIYLSIWF